MAFTICIPIVADFDMMDVANPYEIFSWMKPYWKPADGDLNVLLAGHEAKAPVTAFNGATLLTHASFQELQETPVDVLFVPGGGGTYIRNACSDQDLLNFVSAKGATARFVASVCTGAFVLATAKLLGTLQATTHWMYLAQFQQQFPDVQVVNGYPRYVTDGKFTTGGGISSGIDEALHLVGQIAGDQVARDIQLSIQYRPNPPYDDGDPSVADYTTYKQVTAALS
ncbi:MAG TPA: DJ-1/PfpI family protein [Thermoanaerobaculia bacterium]|nr:DJ-1/PfpI family protein [Thermoanaerobaculia bacterium]